MTNYKLGCKHCGCAHAGERDEEGYVGIKTTDCAACGRDLCEECDQFICVGCDELHCGDHKIMFDGEQACAACALFWAQDAMRKTQRLLEERMQARLNGKVA